MHNKPIHKYCMQYVEVYLYISRGFLDAKWDASYLTFYTKMHYLLEVGQIVKLLFHAKIAVKHWDKCSSKYSPVYLLQNWERPLIQSIFPCHLEIDWVISLAMLGLHTINVHNAHAVVTVNISTRKYVNDNKISISRCMHEIFIDFSFKITSTDLDDLSTLQ